MTEPPRTLENLEFMIQRALTEATKDGRHSALDTTQVYWFADKDRPGSALLDKDSVPSRGYDLIYAAREDIDAGLVAGYLDDKAPWEKGAPPEKIEGGLFT